MEERGKGNDGREEGREDGRVWHHSFSSSILASYGG